MHQSSSLVSTTNTYILTTTEHEDFIAEEVRADTGGCNKLK